jgi:excinuclease ABC subunit B
MERAIQETDRRRIKQREFNQLHNITPVGITKSVTDVMEGARFSAESGRGTRITAIKPDYRDLSPEQALRQIKKLEQQMHKAARDLNFEEAARLRDDIQLLRKVELGIAFQ